MIIYSGRNDNVNDSECSYWERVGRKKQNSFTKVSKNMLNLIHDLEVYFAVPFLLQNLQNSILIIVF